MGHESFAKYVKKLYLFENKQEQVTEIAQKFSAQVEALDVKLEKKELKSVAALPFEKLQELRIYSSLKNLPLCIDLLQSPHLKKLTLAQEFFDGSGADNLEILIAMAPYMSKLEQISLHSNVPAFCRSLCEMA